MGIPVYERRLSVGGIPNARVTAAGGAEAYGSGVGRGVEGLAAAAIRMNEDIEDARTLEAYNNFRRDLRAYHDDAESGILNRLGAETSGLSAEAGRWMDEKADEYASKMKSSRMAENFRRMVGQAIMSQDEHNSRYEADQLRKYRYAEADGTIQTALEDIADSFDDEAAVEAAKERGLMALEVKLRGLGPEAKKAALMEYESGAAAARLGRMIEADPMAAEEWYKANEERFSGAARAKAEALLERETKAYKLEAARDDLIKRHGMNYNAARKEIMENYRGDEETMILSRYEAWYADQKRIQNEAESAAHDNFFRRLQSFGTQQEAMDFALSNSKSLSGFNNAKTFINWIFEGRRQSVAGKLNETLDDIRGGKYHTVSEEQFKGKVAPNFSKDDWTDFILPAYRESRENLRQLGGIANKAIQDDITKIKKNELKGDNALIEKVERRYLLDLKAHPEWDATQRLERYEYLAGTQILYDSWIPFNDTEMRGVDIIEMEKKGEQFNPDTRQWEKINSDKLLSDGEEKEVNPPRGKK